MTEVPAIILGDFGAGDSGQTISRLLEFFGVTSRVVTVEDACMQLAEQNGGMLRVLGSVKNFLRLAGKLGSQPGKPGLARLHSAFCFTENGGDGLADLVGKLAPEGKVRTLSGAAAGQPWKVSEKSKSFTGPFAGLEVAPADMSKPVLSCEAPGPDAEAFISNSSGAALLRLTFHGRPFYLSMSGVIDIDAPLPARDFNIRPYFLTAVPAVLYVKWAFAEICWQPPETTACLTIDDPLLRPRYGFLNYQHLLGLMERENFSTSIAFIPWNWNRSARSTVRLFQENPKRFSLSIHGCDHTAAEYGSRSRDRLAWKSRESMQRMARHRQQTGLLHDQVMVFPQGIFSGAAMEAVKHEGFTGTVNSEVISTDTPARPVTIADYWGVAVMNYSDFPIFTRRYPWAGVENFAFDILLGKPCLTVIHHNDCHDGYRCLLDCIQRLNKLNVTLRWTNLAEVVRRSFRQREAAPEVMEVDIYGSEVRLENLSGAKKLYRVLKRESSPDTIREIRVAEQPVKWQAVGNQVRFDVELNPGESKIVVICFKEIPINGVQGDDLYQQAKAGLRRYLCEVRDNYLMRKEFSK